MPPDDTTVVRIFDKLDTLAKTTGETHTLAKVIEATMIDKKALDAAINGCRANPPRTSSGPGKINGKLTAVIVGAIGALTATVIALIQLL